SLSSQQRVQSLSGRLSDQKRLMVAISESGASQPLKGERRKRKEDDSSTPEDTSQRPLNRPRNVEI
ncbi:hypothetical protein FRC11_001088, partial [Ceratobasidium sp. 423]